VRVWLETKAKKKSTSGFSPVGKERRGEWERAKRPKGAPRKKTIALIPRPKGKKILLKKGIPASEVQGGIGAMEGKDQSNTTTRGERI